MPRKLFSKTLTHLFVAETLTDPINQLPIVATAGLVWENIGNQPSTVVAPFTWLAHVSRK